MLIDRIILDLQTQADFFRPGGACYTPAATIAARNISRLFRWARQHRTPVISTVLRVRPGQIGPMAAAAHCVEGTPGERKLRQTVLPSRINFGLRNTTDLPRNVFGLYQQVIFEMRHTNIFRQDRAERLVTELDTGTFIICGAGLAHGILQAAIALRARGFPVVLAKDACLAVPDPMLQMAFRRIQAKGVIFAPTDEIIAMPRARRTRPLWLQTTA